VLTFGIITAAVLRAVMILLGTELIQKFEPLLIGFAFILLYSAYGLLFNEEDDDDDLSDNAIVKFCRKVGEHGRWLSYFMSAAACQCAHGAEFQRICTQLGFLLAMFGVGLRCTATGCGSRLTKQMTNIVSC
jgi:predicted tellurium resistance membrane protein TerC